MSQPAGPIDVRPAAADRAAGAGSGSSAEDRRHLQQLAAEFESMLMLQMLREMRRTGRWDEGDEKDGGGETQSLFEMLDAELSAQMTKAQGLGMAPQLLEAFDRMQGGRASAETPAQAIGRALEPHGEARAVPDIVGAGQPGSPVPATITSGFGWRPDPLTGQTRFHKGIDLRAVYGQDVSAAAAGRVVFSGMSGDYGTTVLIEHADGTRARYAHLSAALVQPGDMVGRGAPIGRAGSTGRTTGPHLHFEVLDAHGRPVDPTGFALQETGLDRD